MVQGSGTASAIIVAAGMGVRMGRTVRKQYLLLANRPVLYYSLAVFLQCPRIDRIVLVVPEDDLEFCRTSISDPMAPKKPVTLISGGATRQHSVYNGLSALDKKEGVVLIHDGVRPFIRQEQIVACIAGAEENGACILGLPVVDTLKRLDENQTVSGTVSRTNLWRAQTPQAFQYRIIMHAHAGARHDHIAASDDAFLVEQYGFPVTVIEGHRDNIKITTPEDLTFADAIMRVGPWRAHISVP